MMDTLWPNSYAGCLCKHLVYVQVAAEASGSNPAITGTKEKIWPRFSVGKFCLYKHKHKGHLEMIRVCHWTLISSWCFAPASGFVVASSLVAPNVHSEDPYSLSDRSVTGDGHGSITIPWKHSLTTVYRVVYSRWVPIIFEWPLYNTTVLLDIVSVFDKSANHRCFSIILISHHLSLCH
jgi:hypothetical protein